MFKLLMSVHKYYKFLRLCGFSKSQMPILKYIEMKCYHDKIYNDYTELLTHYTQSTDYNYNDFCYSYNNLTLPYKKQFRNIYINCKYQYISHVLKFKYIKTNMKSISRNDNNYTRKF